MLRVYTYILGKGVPVMKKSTQKGFSLVELMVVVAIIGILATLAIPRFAIYQAKSRQAEAKTNLRFIYTLEEAHMSENDDYASMPNHGDGSCASNDLGFMLKPCKSRYVYKADAQTGAGTFSATATSGAMTANKIMRGCASDVWTIDQENTLKASYDVTKKCDK